MNQRNRQTIRTTILNLIAANPARQVEWHEIVQGVKTSTVKVPVNGWLQVRSVLQGMINRGEVFRDTSDIHKELYRSVQS